MTADRVDVGAVTEGRLDAACDASDHDLGGVGQGPRERAGSVLGVRVGEKTVVVGVSERSYEGPLVALQRCVKSRFAGQAHDLDRLAQPDVDADARRVVRLFDAARDGQVSCGHHLEGRKPGGDEQGQYRRIDLGAGGVRVGGFSGGVVHGGTFLLLAGLRHRAAVLRESRGA